MRLKSNYTSGMSMEKPIRFHKRLWRFIGSMVRGNSHSSSPLPVQLGLSSRGAVGLARGWQAHMDLRCELRKSQQERAR